MDYRDYLRLVPKTELHCHFVSTIRPQRLVAWARERGVRLPSEDPAELARYTGLPEFLEVFNAAHAVFRSADDIATVAHEGVLDAVRDSGLRYREYHVNPDGFAAVGIDYPTLLAGLVEGLGRAEAEVGVGFGVVVAIDRGTDLATASAMLEVVLAHPHPAVVGLGQDDLASTGLESATDWAPVYARARAAGLGLTAHVGEIGSSTAASVLEAVAVLGLDRVDHGYHVVDDPQLLERARELGTAFCATPKSAHLLSGWALDRTHPVARMLEAGLAVNLSTDDQAFFDTTLAAEFGHVGLDMGFGPDEVERICLAGVEAAFCDEGTRTRLRARFRGELVALRAALDPT